jgi:hypothetical protein
MRNTMDEDNNGNTEGMLCTKHPTRVCLEHPAIALQLLPLVKVNILCYDYTGYGLNKGTPSEKACYEDINTVFKWLTVKHEIPVNRILLYVHAQPHSHCIETIKHNVCLQILQGMGSLLGLDRQLSWLQVWAENSFLLVCLYGASCLFNEGTLHQMQQFLFTTLK